MSTWTCLKADTFRACGRSGVGPFLKCLASYRTFRVLTTMRVCQGISKSGWPAKFAMPIAQALHRFATHQAAMDLSWRTAIGEGAALTHGWGMVVSANALIGSNCTLFHGVTIGRRDRIADDGSRTTAYPTLEDDVWVGPHAVIVGGVTIGRGSRIAAGAFVTEDVPPHSIVAGNPAQVVKSGCKPDVTNRWPR